MPYRLMTLWVVIVGLLGVIALGLLVALGKNPRRVAANATGWKRKLLIAGLAMLGLSEAGYAQEVTTPASTAQVSESAEALSALQDSEEWQRFDAGWRQAEAASGLSYFETEAEQQACLEGINFPALQDDVAMLVSLGSLTEAEGALLAAGLEEMASHIAQAIPGEVPWVVTDPGSPPPEFWRRVENTLPLLESVAIQDVVDPAVIEAVLAMIDREWARLETVDEHDIQVETELRFRADDDMVWEDVFSEIAQARERFLDSALLLARRYGDEDIPLAETRQWQHLIPIWREAAEIDSGARGRYPFTEAEKCALQSHILQAMREVDTLRRLGHLSASEHSFLREELARLDGAICRFRPVELQGATCYMGGDMTTHPMARWLRCESRVELIESILAQGALQPEVAQVMTQSFVHDLNSVLADDAVARFSQYLRRLPEYAELSDEELHELVATRRAELLDAAAHLQARLEAIRDQAAE
jgi:hypothetical protein